MARVLLHRFPTKGVAALASVVWLATAYPAAQQAPVAGYPPLSDAQESEVRAALEAMKRDSRGPYQRIAWFCNDGTRIRPQEGNCQSRGGGHQRAEFSATAERLAGLGFHPGTILMALEYDEFVDEARANYRLRELVVESYLIEADDGWVLRRARYYRGAVQIEDEERRGREFLVRLLDDPTWRRAHYLLANRLAAVVPHGQPGVPGARIRQLAEDMAALDARLQELRIKIHSRPGPEDLEAIRAFRRRSGELPRELELVLDNLSAELAVLYHSAFDAGRWVALIDRLRELPIASSMQAARDVMSRSDATREQVRRLALVTREARDLIDGRVAGVSVDGRRTLALLDTVNYADALLKAAAGSWLAASLPTSDATGTAIVAGAADRPASRYQLLTLAHDLIDAAYGSGWLSAREHQALARERLEADAPPSAGVYRENVHYLGNATDWGQAVLQQSFASVVQHYRQVEPAVTRFEDAVIRGSVLLPLANLLDALMSDADRLVGVVHSVFDLNTPGRVRGLNPGVALGTLYVVENPERIEAFDPGGIYVIPETYAELGRIAGILTLQEGSRLSHVQLLARSLGIPNVVVSPQLSSGLGQYAGQEVFLAVSNLGTVVLKLRSTMRAEDIAIVEQGTAAPEDPIEIDEDKLDLGVQRIMTLDEIDLQDSGRIVGPKAANLARLRQVFPDRVAQGLVIPFGVFRRHIDRDLLGSGRTLYQDLALIYDTAARMEAAGTPRNEVSSWVLVRLREVRDAIRHMDLLPDFETELRDALRRTFGTEGSYGVFVRSDTNVEDLPNFTGAGLNLTMMNQISEADILHAVRQVWASPFTERSFTWRQQLLANPLPVYPSIVLLQSVPVQASGVLVTKDLSRDRPGWWTVTLSQGVGGVVDGEPAETVLLPAAEGEPILLSSARATWQKVLLMTGSGGIMRVPVSGDATLLNNARARDLRTVTTSIIEQYAPLHEDDGGAVPWDVEFGFLGDRTQLFQIRPLLTNRRVRTLQALTALDSALLAGDHGPVDLNLPPMTR